MGGTGLPGPRLPRVSSDGRRATPATVYTAVGRERARGGGSDRRWQPEQRPHIIIVNTLCHHSTPETIHSVAQKKPWNIHALHYVTCNACTFHFFLWHHVRMYSPVRYTLLPELSTSVTVSVTSLLRLFPRTEWHRNGKLTDNIYIHLACYMLSPACLSVCPSHGLIIKKQLKLGL